MAAVGRGCLETMVIAALTFCRPLSTQYMHASFHTRKLASIHKYIHTYLHTYVPAYLHTYTKKDNLD